MSGYRLVERVPSVEDYNRVRSAAGLGRRDPSAANVGLPNTLFGVCVESDERVVGIGRGSGVVTHRPPPLGRYGFRYRCRCGLR